MKKSDIVDLLRTLPADEGLTEDAADEIERLRAEVSTLNKVIYDLTEGITGTLQADELERLNQQSGEK
jgi:hypothetical protein